MKHRLIQRKGARWKLLWHDLQPKSSDIHRLLNFENTLDKANTLCKGTTPPGPRLRTSVDLEYGASSACGFVKDSLVSIKAEAG